MRLRKIIRLFENGNVCVTGLRGRGKDMLIANVVVRRNKPYISNVNYDPDNHINFDPTEFHMGRNGYKNFIEGRLNRYIYPYEDGIDIYISDAGVYYPSQYCNELNREYPYIPTFCALSRQLGACNVHFNVQNLNRMWDKYRELSDTYIACNWCKVFFGRIVIQKVTLYDLYDSCVRRVKPYIPVCGVFAPRESKNLDLMERRRFEQNNGLVKSCILVYLNRSTYDTRVFKRMLEEGV